MKAAKDNPVLINFYKRLYAFRAARYARLSASGKARRRAEYILILREYFQKLHDERKFEESWAILKLIAKDKNDYRCIQIRHSQHVTAGIPELGANAMWSKMMLSTVDFALLKVFSDIAFGRELSSVLVL